MARLYSQSLMVAPFLIAPALYSGKQAAVLVSPQDLARKSEILVGHLATGPGEAGISASVVVQISNFEGGVVLATTIQTKQREPASGRIGLMLAYGAWLAKPAIVDRTNLCSKVFDLHHAFFRRRLHSEATVETLDGFVVNALQATNDDDLLSHEDAARLVEEFESEFGGAERSSRLNRPKRHMRRIRGGITARGFRTLEQAMEFWRQIDFEDATPATPSITRMTSGGRVLGALGCLGLIGLAGATYVLGERLRYVQSTMDALATEVRMLSEGVRRDRSASHNDPTPTVTPSAQPRSPSDNEPFESLLQELFGQNSARRVAARQALEQSWRTNERLPATLLDHALRQKDNKNGIVNALHVLLAIEPRLLEANRQRLLELLESVSSNGETTATAAEQVRAKLERR